ncbi:MAG: Gfo/Idh/MocA family oxidoreductase, partial [Planctomycetota bacterium]|nr:Gfo/Idh/MocA family oxidoreductase [Planctomycetota bacterium]
MDMKNKTNQPAIPSALTRRDFVKTAGATVAATTIASPLIAKAANLGQDTINIGVIGCGGRGSGAVVNALEASADVRLVAMADVFPDRLASSRKHLETLGDRAKVNNSRTYVGFNAYQELLDHGDDLDYVILATPPHFRPIHLAAAIKANKNVFMEKPVAVDPEGIRSVIMSGLMAERKKLSIVAGTQRRH